MLKNILFMKKGYWSQQQLNHILIRRTIVVEQLI